MFTEGKVTEILFIFKKAGNKNCIFCEKIVKYPFFVLSRLFFWSLFGCLIKKVYLCKENINGSYSVQKETTEQLYN